MLAAFLAFMATTNSGEQVRKALFRVAGTAIGIVVGDLLVHVTGGNVWAALPIVLVALFLGIYLIRVNYTFMVIGITVMLSLLYVPARRVQLAPARAAPRRDRGRCGRRRPHRAGGRAAASAARADHGRAAVVPRAVGPARRRRSSASRAARRATCGPLIRDARRGLGRARGDGPPLRHATFGRNSSQLAEIRAVSSAARFYLRSLAEAVRSIELPDIPELQPAVRDLHASTAAIENRIETGHQGVYMRSAALIDDAARAVPADADPSVKLALRDLTMLDSAFARLARALDMDVRDHDTSDLLGAPATS